MLGTSDLNMINLQVQAQSAIVAAQADGSYRAKRAADRKAFLWQSHYQTIPIGTETDPVGFALALRRALPLVNALRIPFNAYSFNADGSLDPRFEALLTEAARLNFRILFVYMDGEGQRYGSPQVPGTARASAADIAQALRGEIFDRAETSFGRLMDWLDRHPQVRAATWGLELMNEPAAFKIGMNRLPQTDAAGRARFVQLYAEVMVRLARSVEQRWSGSILVGGFAYSADFNILAQTRMAEGGETALDFIRRGVGPKLVWSAHLYPGWGETGRATSAADLPRRLQAQYGALGGDALLVTETNAPAFRTYDPARPNDKAQYLAESWDWFAAHGIGIVWFPGAQGGESSFVTFRPGQPLLFENLNSYGAGMDAYTLGDPGTPAAQNLRAVLIPGDVKMPKTDPAAMLRQDRGNGAQGIAVAAGGAGDDTIKGAPAADNFLYGGPGDDRIEGAGRNDYLYGQAGNDTLLNPSGSDHIFGGRGNDLIVDLGSGYSEIWGGPGADRFSIGTRARVVIADFAPQDGDTVDFRGHYQTVADVLRHCSVLDYTGTGGSDLMVWHDDGGYTIFLGMGGRLLDFARALAEFPAPAALPTVPAGATVRGLPFSPLTGIDPDGPPITPKPEPPAVSLAPAPGRTTRARGDAGILSGILGNDRILGQASGAEVETGPGNDSVALKPGPNTIFAGAGNDTVDTGQSGARIVLGAGTDLVRLSLLNSRSEIWTGSGRETFEITSVGRFRRPGHFALAQIYGFDPSRDGFRYTGKPIDLSDLPQGFDYTAFWGGHLLSVNGYGLIYLYDAKKLRAGPPRGDDPAELAFDPRYDPKDPARHLR